VSTHEIEHLIHQYGCALVFVIVALQAIGAPLPGTTVLIAAAVYAAGDHGLPITGVIAAAALGALSGTAIAYAVGRWGGERLLLAAGRRLRQPPGRVQALRRELAAGGGAWLFASRFVTGARNVAGLLAGASGMPPRRFAVFAAAAALTWATVNALEYYFFGRAIAGADTWVQVVLVAAGIVWMLFTFRFLHRRARRRLQAT
jgi:membrane protein DedA with SNARE-associated domain